MNTSLKTYLSQKYFILLSIIFVLSIVTIKRLLTGHPFFLSYEISYLDDLVVIVLYLFILRDASFYRLKYPTNIFFYLFLTLAIYGLLQGILLQRNVAINSFIFLYRDNFWYFPVFYFIWKYANDHSFSNNIINSVYFFIYIQLLYFSFQEIYSLITDGRILFEDNVNGTLGFHAAHYLAYSLILTIPFLLGRKNYFLLIGVSVIIIMTSARSVIFLFPLSFLISCLINKKFKILLIGSLAFLLIFLPIGYFYSKKVVMTLDPVKLILQQNNKLEKESNASRIAFLLYSIGKLDTKKNLFFGYGIASYASRTGTNLNGPEYVKYEHDFPFKNEFIAGGSTFNYWLVEYGLIGTFLLILFYAYQISFLRRNTIVFTSYLTVLLSLLGQKSFESYSVCLLYWYLFPIYLQNCEKTNQIGAA